MTKTLCSSNCSKRSLVNSSIFKVLCALSLLPAMVCDVQNELRILTEKFCKAKEVHAKDGSTRTKTPNPCTKRPYTYLIAWFVLYSPTLMSSIYPQTDRSSPIVQHYERSQWKGHFMVMIRKYLQHHINYYLYKCFPYFSNADYGDVDEISC